jgi:hypothetical protein
MDVLIVHSEDQAMKLWKGTIAAGILVGLTIFGSFSAWANPYNSYVDQRRVNQEQLIRQAWQSGQLTSGQYRHLNNQLQNIRMVENQMRADGRLDPGEKFRINDMLKHKITNVVADLLVYDVFSPALI